MYSRYASGIEVEEVHEPVENCRYIYVPDINFLQ